MIISNINKIDTNYDFSEDYRNNIDPDRYNKILRNWHKILWKKKLPYKDEILTLSEKSYGLYHNSDLGEYFLTSDSIIPTFSTQNTIPEIIKNISKKDIENFFRIACKIGGYILFPGWQSGKIRTINVARGLHPRIADRFDLTLECIRLYYLDIIEKEQNPLGYVLIAYDNFFKLFDDFKGYCNFFLLQDLTIENYSKVNFFLPFDGFTTKPRPTSVNEYKEYMKNSIEFVLNRNKRIEEYCESKST